MDDTSKTKENKQDFKNSLSTAAARKLGRGLHPRHAPRPAALESKHRLTQHATQESKNKIHFALCKKTLCPARHVLEDTSHQTRPQIDAGDASLLIEIVSPARVPALCHHGRSGYQSLSLVPSPDELVVCTV
jgi:hypothetical protein